MTEIRRPSRTLITGPSGVGKTRLTSMAIREWMREYGTDGIVILEFGPHVRHDDRVIGGHLERFNRLPPDAWCGIAETTAPRLLGDDEAATRRLAKQNAIVAAHVIDEMPPDPVAVFVNDATIPFQHPDADPNRLLDRLADADHVVINAFAGSEFGPGEVTDQEQSVLQALRSWVDHEITLTQ